MFTYRTRLWLDFRCFRMGLWTSISAPGLSGNSPVKIPLGLVPGQPRFSQGTESYPSFMLYRNKVTYLVL